MYRRTRNFFSKRLNWTLVLCTIIFIFSTVFLYRRALVLTDTAGSNQVKLHELALAKTGARSIEILLELIGKSLYLMIENQEFTRFGPNTQKILNNFFLDFQHTPVSALIVTDASGVVRFTVNTTHTQSIVGTSVAGMNYFAWATKADPKSIYVETPTLENRDENKNNTVVIVATPIFNQETFQGVVVAEILLTKFTHQYFDSLKLSKNTHIFIVNTNGIFLYAPYPDWIGISVFDYISRTPFAGNMQLRDFITSNLAQMQEGTTELIWPQYQTGILAPYVAAYAPIQFANQKFLLILSTPQQEIGQTFSQVYRNQIVLLILLLMIIAFFSALLILGIRLAQREAFQKGFIIGREHTPKKYG